jgi:hypothetical protein
MLISDRWTKEATMIVRVRFVFLQVFLVVTAMVATTLPARAQATGGLDQSANGAFRSLFSTASSASEAEQGQAPRQNPRHEGIGIGAKVGPLFSKFSSDVTNLKFSNRTGLMGGIFFGGNRAGVAGVMGEIMYAKKGSKDAAGITTDIYYLEIPVLLRINAGSNSLNGILGYALIGPVFDINLKAKLNGITDVKAQYEDFDIGIIGGAGVEITRFIIEGRYNWGLRKVNKGNLANLSEIKTRSFALLFGVRFN